MQIASPGRPHLTYCTNIHAGESLAEVSAAVGGHVVAVKRALSPDAPFGVGLRLAARASSELGAPGALAAFQTMLRDQGLYVFTINGFPFGTFHGARVKEAVYRPDWLEPERVAYSDRLAWQLAALLPDGVPGSISTVPGAFKPRLEAGGERRIAELVLEHAATLFRVREETGKLVELCLEPEPCCFLETTDEAVRFFEERLFARDAVQRFGTLIGLDASAAETFLRRHLGVCLDACHLAVEFEDAGAAVARLDASGVRIGKVQVTDALAVRLSGDPREDEATFSLLERFADDVYLHQVVERKGTELVRHLDLPDALRVARAAGRCEPSEWRIHFHVPVFAERLGALGSTQPFLRDLLALVSRRPVSAHLEVETYTWDVLPPEHRAMDVNQGIVRELAWTLERLGVAGGGVS
ncbi:MAG TPA: metabolite traffic protein EboE [Polyangiaceae bacterium]|jgi:sugar phosphate isomerase/epimerase|nr:metabolite traffic protein EboE [Polyangiaceae bacterium]